MEWTQRWARDPSIVGFVSILIKSVQHLSHASHESKWEKLAFFALASGDGKKVHLACKRNKSYANGCIERETSTINMHISINANWNSLK